MQVSDGKIIELCKNNKREGFELLFEKYEKYIYRLCYYHTHSKEDSLDLLQEVYIKIFKHISGFEKDRPLLPWLKTITVNVCLNHIRDHKNQPVSLNGIPGGEESSLEVVLASPVNVEETIDYLDTKKTLEQAIFELPEDMKTAVILRHVEGMSYEEIGKIMSLPLGTVKTNLFRGRRLLKEKLKTEGIWEV